MEDWKEPGPNVSGGAVFNGSEELDETPHEKEKERERKKERN